MNSEVKLPLVLQTTKVLFALVGGILGAVFVLGVVVAITKPEAGAWPAPLMSGCLLALAVGSLRSAKLVLTEDAIHYRFFLKRTDVPLADIADAKFVIGFSGYKPFQRLVVKTRKESGNKEIIINVGWFDPPKIKQWVKGLDARRSSIRK